MVKFSEKESHIFDKVIEVLKHHSIFEEIQWKGETVLSLSELEIYLDRRKVYCNRREISLTTKEYNLLHLLVVNKGRVLTYGQIYQNVWGEAALGNEKMPLDAISVSYGKNFMRLHRILECVKKSL